MAVNKHSGFQSQDSIYMNENAMYWGTPTNLMVATGTLIGAGGGTESLDLPADFLDGTNTVLKITVFGKGDGMLEIGGTTVADTGGNVSFEISCYVQQTAASTANYAFTQVISGTNTAAQTEFSLGMDVTAAVTIAFVAAGVCYFGGMKIEKFI